MAGDFSAEETVFLLWSPADIVDYQWPSPVFESPFIADNSDVRVVARQTMREGMTLTVCPLSNNKLCVVKDLNDHPIPDMLAKGLRATINSDDPAYFGGYVNDNFLSLTRRGLIDREDCLTLARNSINGAFLPDERKAALIAEIETFAAEH